MIRRTVAIALLFISITTIILVPIFTFTPIGKSFFNGSTLTPTPTFIPFTPTPTPKPTPILTAKGTPPAITGSEAILLDNDTGHILYESNGEKPVPMASTTKIMTALIAIQVGDLNSLVTVHKDAVNEVILNDGSGANLHAGDQLTLRDLLYGLMLPSGDDAAIAIADTVGGSPSNFVNMMNLFAYRLHLFQTHFINPDGLTYYDANRQPIPGHYTTPYDLVRLASYAMTIPL
ncbi:MAG TPA: serine hydrolase, partial [Ktedonobacteraceae bacterium]|nr:serine hydrolase [Ktedonobacteraceae bacterium]